MLQLIGLEVVRRTAMPKTMIGLSSNLGVVIRGAAHVRFLRRLQLPTRLSTFPTGKDSPWC
jgi:hypothetical protein